MNLAQSHFTNIAKALAIGLGFFVISFALLSSQADAVEGINRTINFQGKLINNPTKTNVTDTSYTVVFTIYDHPTSGTALWSETQSVTTADGIFRVALGSQTPIPSDFNFNWDGLYLGMKVNADSEMTPRVQLAAVPYAFNAERVAGLTVQDTAGNASTSGTLQIGNGTTINLGDNDISFTTSGGTTLTLPTTGTLATLAGAETFTNKTIGSTGLTFSGAGTDITSATDEDITITPNGAGKIVLSGDFNSGIVVGQDGGIEFPLLVRNGIGSRATLVVDQLNAGDLFTASASGVTRFVVENTGNILLAAGQGVDTLVPGALNIGDTNASSAVLGSSSLDSFTVTTNSTGDSEVSLPAQSIGSSEILNNTIDFTQISNSPSLDATTTLTSGSNNFVINLDGTGDFLLQDATTAFAQFLDDGSISLGKAAAATTLNLATGTAGDVVNIGTDTTTGDTLAIGNNNASTTLSLTGGTAWSISTTGGASFGTLSGAGLTDCDGTTDKILWNSASGTFSCGTDLGADLQILQYRDTTQDANASFTAASDVWDGTYPNIDPANTGNAIMVSVTILGTGNDNTDSIPVFSVRRNVDTNPTCTDTQVGGNFAGSFATSAGDEWTAAATFRDAPASTGNVRYTVCLTAAGADDGNVDEITVVLTEIGSGSGGTGGSSLAVRESDGNPSVGSVTTLELGPASTSEEDFVVTDQGGGVVRVSLGSQVPRLEDSDTVTGGWTFNTADTTFTTGIIANGGLHTTTNTNLSIDPDGTGDAVFTVDADTNVQIAASAAPAVDMLSISNSGQGITTDGVNGLNIDFTTTDTIGARTNSAINIDVSGGATEVADSLYGINIGNLTGASNGTEVGLNIGTGWDSAIVTNNGNIDAGTGTLTAATWDASGATALSLGSGDVLSLTVATNGTGDSEVVLPDESIGTTEITNDSLTPTDFAATQTYSDGDFVDLASIIHDDTALQGFRLPQNSSLSSPVSGEGFLAYNTSTKLVQVYNGSGWTAITGGGGASTLDELYAASVTATDTVLDVDDSSGLTFDLTTTGDFIIQDDSTAFATFANTGVISLGKASVDSTINIGTGTGIDTINIGTGTGADVLSLGNASGTIAITASNLTLNSSGVLTMSEELILSSIDGEGISGGGLSDCDGATDKLLWDSTTNKFSCGTDSNIASVYDVYDNAGGQSVTSTDITVNLDTVRRSHSNYSLSSDEITVNADGVYSITFTGGAESAGTRGSVTFYIETNTGSGFSKVDGSDCEAYNRTTTSGSSCSKTVVLELNDTDDIRLRAVVSGSDNATTIADVSSMTVALLEDTTGGGGGGGINGIGVRESDGSPTVTDATTIEFGPVSSNVDFVITDQGSGVARVELGSGVAKLGDDETVTGTWTFNNTSTTFSNILYANSGVSTTSNTDLSLAANGNGNITLAADADTAVIIGTATTLAPLSIQGGIGANAALIVDQLNSADVFTASASGSTVFTIANDGSISLTGDITTTGDLIVNGDDIISDGTLTLDAATDIYLDAANGNILLRSAATTYATFTNSSNDLTIDVNDGQIILADNDTINIGGVSGLTYNAIGDTGTADYLNGDDDLWIEGSLEVDETVYIDGATGLVLGATTDITTGTDQALTFSPNGTGDVAVLGDADTNLQIVFGAAPAVDMTQITNAGQGTSTDGVDGLEIDFENAGSGAITNAGLRIEATSNNTNASSNLYGLEIDDLVSGGESSSEVALRIGTGWDQGLVIESGGSTNSGLRYSGDGRPTKKIVLSPEYSGGFITDFYGAGTDTNITGSMTSDGDTTLGTSIRSYYEWNSSETGTQHYYTVAVRVTLPSDFDAWATSNAMVVNYITGNASATQSDVDVRVYNDNSSVVVATDLDNSSVSWTSVVIDDSVLDDGVSSEWDGAEETAVIYLRLGSRDDDFVRIGDIELNYLAAF